MDGEFKLEIALGNAAMSEPWTIANALRSVADRVQAGSVTGQIKDLNGNQVGVFWIEDTE